MTALARFILALLSDVPVAVVYKAVSTALSQTPMQGVSTHLQGEAEALAEQLSGESR